MNLLIDTRVFLWWDSGAQRLGAAARGAIADPANTVWVSAASVWEIAIKRAKGRLRFEGAARVAIEHNGFQPLPITAGHAEAAGALDWIHPDPFDRMLVAQAVADHLTLVHADETIGAFRGVAQLWAR